MPNNQGPIAPTRRAQQKGWWNDKNPSATPGDSGVPSGSKWQRLSEWCKDRGVSAPLVVSIASLIVAVVAMWEGMDNSATNRKSLVYSNRAWLVVSRMNIKYHPGAFIIEVPMTNIGKTPAIRTVWTFSDISWVATPNDTSISDAIESAKIAFNPTCDPRKTDFGNGKARVPIWPGEPGDFSSGARYYGDYADALMRDLSSASRTFVIQGCFTYETLGTVHHTKFCRYLAPIANVPAKNWLFSVCPFGEDFD